MHNKQESKYFVGSSQNLITIKCKPFNDILHDKSSSSIREFRHKKYDTQDQ